MNIEYLTKCNSRTNVTKGTVVDAVKFISSNNIPLHECLLDSKNLCKTKCDSTFKGEIIKETCKISGEDNIKKEILANGPIAITIKMKSDFPTYKKGIYQYRPKAYNITKDHIVKVIGWGEMNGIKYWHIENTWGKDWGENGYGRIEISSVFGITKGNALAIRI